MINAPESKKIIIRITKLIDTALRSACVLIPLYGLPQAEAVIFGGFIPIVGIFSLVAGFELYYIVLHAKVNKNQQFSSALGSYIAFYIINYLILIIPIFLFFNFLNLSLVAMLIAFLLLICEHCYQEIYRISYATDSNNLMLFIFPLSRYAGFLLCWFLNIFALDFFRPSFFAYISMWLLFDISFMILILFFVLDNTCLRISLSIKSYLTLIKASYFYFLLGLLAFLTANAERLIAISLLNGETLIAIIRAFTLFSIPAQASTILCHNPSLPYLFRLLKDNKLDKFWRSLFIQWTFVIGLFASFIITTFVAIKTNVVPTSLLEKLPPFSLSLCVSFIFISKYISDSALIPLAYLGVQRRAFVFRFILISIFLMCTYISSERCGMAGLVISSMLSSIITMSLSILMAIRSLKRANYSLQTI